MRGLLDSIDTQGDEALASRDVARFRLLSGILDKHGNDDVVLGVHDSNLLFSSRGQHVFSESERFALVKSGLEHFVNQNTPLWFWLTAVDGIDGHLLSLYSIRGTSSERKASALNAMRLIGEKLSDKAHIT